ncbi:hypothetical protein C8R43DRAFT_1032267 [Mycena crocata]|nr:hypothetical protein C8R43DRAFT_1032267 [Mycena crocata]
MSTNLTALLTLVAAGFSASNYSTTPFDAGFNISAVTATAKFLPSHSWEYGTAAQAILELESPDLSVFGLAPFPVPARAPETVSSLAYAATKIQFGIHGISNGGGAAADPASLGVAAVMLGKTNDTFANATQAEIDYVLDLVPRWPNGAISHRADFAELWADFMYMLPPFIAYFAADTNNATLLEASYLQCGYYREVLLFGSNATEFAPTNTSVTGGLWHHIVGPQSPEPGLWSTGNAWAAAGMARVLATIIKAPVAHGTKWRHDAIADLTAWIKEIIDGARAAEMDGGLLRNYLNDNSTEHGFGEISGSALLAATAYRMVLLAPDVFTVKPYVAWADSIRTTLGGYDAAGNPHITVNGTATPAVNPLGWLDPIPFTAGSPEGNNFVVLLYAAWRDCVWSRLCKK